MIKLARIFQSSMVLQREKKVKIWGKSSVSQSISLKLNGNVEVVKDIKSGYFTLFLPAKEASVGNRIVVTGSSGDKVILEDVNFGEVWIAGGQSNMEFLLRYDAEGEEMVKKANDEHIRFYYVAEYAFHGERKEGFKDDSKWDTWLSFNPQNAEYFSAVGLYFAHVLRKKYKIPIGIVGCNWGGTTAAAWTDQEILRNDPDLRVYTDEYEQALENLDLEKYQENNRKMREKRAKNNREEKLLKGINPFIEKILTLLLKLAPKIPIGPHNENRPGGLYEVMVKKIAGYTCRGVIWYQGESDADRSHLYSKLFSSMISCWRRDWREELPFLFVQLAPFKKWLHATGDNFPILREEQEKVSKTVSVTWMASIMDAGMKRDIHPKSKRPVGERLALLAMGKVYNEDILCEAPELENVEKNDGELRLKFCNTGQGMYIKGNKLNAIQLYSQSKEIKKYSIKLDKNRLIVESETIEKEKVVEVRFAKKPYCEVNLYNSADLPAKPFSWKG